MGAALAVAVAAAAYRARALSASGAFAACVVGAVTFGTGGWQAAAVLLAFFIPSALLSRYRKTRKQSLANTGKKGPRDAWQVAANGGIAVLAILLSPRYGGAMCAAFAGAFAAASADTWGTEIGTLARSKPRSILTARTLEPGISGGITVRGTIAEVAGAACVALVAAAVHIAPFFAVFLGGIAGALADSLLGAGVQALRYCPRCEQDCETNPHECATPTSLRRGVAWIENDAVNLAASTCGAALAAAVFLL